MRRDVALGTPSLFRVYIVQCPGWMDGRKSARTSGPLDDVVVILDHSTEFVHSNRTLIQHRGHLISVESTCSLHPEAPSTGFHSSSTGAMYRKNEASLIISHRFASPNEMNDPASICAVFERRRIAVAKHEPFM